MYNWDTLLGRNMSHKINPSRTLSWMDGESDDKVMMQFTGLFDMQDEKIFEGDIVQGEDGKKREVRFDDSRFCLWSTDGLYVTGLGIVINNPYEVIGNIHENHEANTVDRQELATKLHATCEAFQADMARIADDENKKRNPFDQITALDIFAGWVGYERISDMFDQSPIVFEFEQQRKNKVCHDAPVAPVSRWAE